MFRCAVLVGLLAAFASAAYEENANFLSTSAPDGSSFRFDYRFFLQARGWLKLHRTSASWYNARLTCRLEGARLASPIDEGVYDTMRTVLQNSTLNSIFTGINGIASSTDYFSVEGVHITNMPLQWDGQPSSSDQTKLCLAMADDGTVSEASCGDEKPFFCYKPLARIRMNARCGTTDEGYIWESRTNSCYKVHRSKMTWFEGYTTCAAEGGHLTVINSVEEAQVLSDISRGIDDYVFVGLVNWYQDDGFDIDAWRTIHGETLEESGFGSGWLPGQPDQHNNNEFCGSIGWDSRVVGLNDISCLERRPFICEVTRARVPLWW